MLGRARGAKAWLALLAALPILAVGSGSAATAGASSPPRNGLIAVAGPNGIHIVDPQTRSAALLPVSDMMSDPAWSPDGTVLAFTSWGDDSSFNVYTMKPDGSERGLVLRSASSPSWSPDGKWLTTVREDEAGSRLVIVKADGTEVRDLIVDEAADGSYVSEPSWSPDGKLIAFVEAGDELSRIRFVTPDGEAVSVEPVAAQGGNLSWSPDSSRLSFDRFLEGDESSRQVIVVLDVATGRETVLQGRQDGAGSAVWSPDGKQLAYLSTRATPVPAGSLGCGGHTESQLWVMSADGTNPHRLVVGLYVDAPSWARSLEPEPTPSLQSKPTPSFQAQPKQSFQPEPRPTKSFRAGPKPSTGSVAAAETPPAADEGRRPASFDSSAAAWSPDAKQLAFVSGPTPAAEGARGDSSGLWVVAADGEKPPQLLATGIYGRPS